MKRNILIGLLILALFLTSSGVCGLPDETETQSGETNAELEAFRELYKIGSGFYSITSGEISQFVRFLAGPDLQGRVSGTEGSKKAGLFLMEELESYFLDIRLFQEFKYSEIKNPQNDGAAEYLSRLGFEVREDGRNVVAILEGKGKKEEYVVISAHYDHLGINRDGRVYPGADDNASGTAAVLEIAEAFGILAEEGIRPERSIIFAFFDAEENGLWGSQYFVENPPVPFDQIVAVINLDMIGRNELEKLEMAGYGRNTLLSQPMAEANAILKFNLIWDQSSFDRSDQASFFYASPTNNRLPVVLFTAGLHSDYHTPLDTADKINFEKVRNVARFAFFIAWLIANLK